MKKRTGVFVCHCGINIGAYVDVPSVVEYAKTLDGVAYAEDNLYTCSQDTQKKIVEKIKEHPDIGASILMPIKELNDIAREIKYHQERYDGKGYPDGLKGTEIPLIARMIAVCDAFDAITTDRPYRQRAMSEFAIQEIRDGSGTQFDPIVVSAFLLAYEKGNVLSFKKKKK